MSMKLAAAVLAALTITPAAFGSGGHYVVDGGTAQEQAQVAAALNASSFNWSVVPQTVQIHITPGTGQHLTSIPQGASTSTPGEITISADVLDLGPLSWGIVQHEYGHQVDFFVLTDAERAQLTKLLGGQAWSYDGTLPHQDYTAERFASLLSETFWPVWQNVEAATTSTDTYAAIQYGATPTALRALLVKWGLVSPACRVEKVKRGHYVRHRWIKPVYRKVCV